MADHPHIDLYAAEVERHFLALREALVRHDENMKAWRLCEAAPYFIADRPAVQQAIADQREMVLHAIEPEAYPAYYADNPHERAFEQQYGVSVERAHEAIPRFGWLRERLAERGITKMLDLSCNDGAMAANLALVGVACGGIDLNPGCVERAKGRLPERRFRVGDFRDHAAFLTRGFKYPAVTLLETVEHLPDPAEGLHAAAAYVKHDGHLYVSTPLEAVERGNLPGWDRVERKGHLWSFTASQFHELCEAVGTVETFWTGPDRVMCAEVAVA